MKIKIAKRKLNRTLLKKEGTKEVYITGGPVLMPFFGVNDINTLPTKRSDEAAKRIFKTKQGELPLRVTRENNEVRLTGFMDYFDVNGIVEVDSILLFRYEDGTTNEFVLDFEKNNSVKVLQKFNVNDSVQNYEVTANDKGRIQFVQLPEPVEVFENEFWCWDDSFSKELWDNIIEEDIPAIIVLNNSCRKSFIRIKETGNVFNKLMKAVSNSNNNLEYQIKHLYKLYEKTDDGLIPLDLGNIRNVELQFTSQKVIITNRDSESFKLYEGGTSDE